LVFLGGAGRASVGVAVSRSWGGLGGCWAFFPPAGWRLGPVAGRWGVSRCGRRLVLAAGGVWRPGVVRWAGGVRAFGSTALARRGGGARGGAGGSPGWWLGIDAGSGVLPSWAVCGWAGCPGEGDGRCRRVVGLG